jgi:hypothetical protein
VKKQVCAALLFCASCAAARGPEAPAPVLAIPADWRAAPQADLADQLAKAPELTIQDLGTAVYGVDDPNDSGINMVPCADKSYDILLWYRKAYKQNTKVYIVNTGTGKVTLQSFDQEQGKIRMEQGFTWWGVLGTDGKLYAANTDWPQFDRSDGMVNIYRYDPAEKKVSLFTAIPGHGGETTALALSPTGWIYGSGTWAGQGDRHQKASAYGFNPVTGEVRNFGAVGPKINGTGYGASIGCCDTHVYVACGKIPWYCVSIDMKTGEQKTILTAPEGGDLMYINSSPKRFFGGAVACTQQGYDAPKKYFWLYHGQAIPKKTDGWEMDESCPWPKETQAKSPTLSALPPPETHTGQLYPDANDKAVLWWRQAQAEGEAAKAPWSKVTLEGVQKYPLKLHRFMNLPDGRMFGTGDGYKGRFLFDPKTEKVSYLGRGGGSLYCLAVLGDKLYWSGYDCGRIFEFDPARPWNLEAGGPPGENRIASTDTEATKATVNPRRTHQDPEAIFKLTRVKKMLSATTAADGRVYFGGKGQRDYEGGGLSWYDPKTRECGGFWKPFDNRSIGWVTGAHDAPAPGASAADIRTPGRYVVIGTEGGKVFIYDTNEHKLLEDKSFTPMPGAEMSGPCIEVAPGRMFGITWPGKNRTSGVLYGVEVPSGKVFFTKEIPFCVPFDWWQGTGDWDFLTGPDGFLWATVNDGKTRAIARIDPRDASVQIVGKVNPLGHMAFVGNDLYLTGTTQIRRIDSIVKPPATP